MFICSECGSNESSISQLKPAEAGFAVEIIHLCMNCYSKRISPTSRLNKLIGMLDNQQLTELMELAHGPSKVTEYDKVHIKRCIEGLVQAILRQDEGKATVHLHDLEDFIPDPMVHRVIDSIATIAAELNMSSLAVAIRLKIDEIS